MAQKLGSEARPLRVAVIGSGPSAFYAVEALFKTEGLTCRVDMFDRLPTPYGLVRGGVAPDHQKIKGVVRIYEGVAKDDRFRFFGNVMLGRDVQVADLGAHYDHVIYAVGNESDRDLGIEGEELGGVHSATEFVGWYNGHPDFRDRQFDLENAERAVVVGNGNVAMDVTRVLLRDPDELADTDIADHALELLRKSKVREVVLLGRRGAAQAAFSTKEIQEIAKLGTVDLVVAPEEVEVDPASRAWLDGDAPRAAQRNLEFLTTQSAEGEGQAERKVRCVFCASPEKLLGDDGRVAGVRVRRNELHADDSGTPRPKATDATFDVECQLVFKAVGYRGVPIEGVPFHDRWGTIPNQDGRVLESADGDVRPGHYVVGWAKRGPSGLIGTNSPDSKATVAAMIEDLGQADELPSDGSGIEELLEQRGVDAVSWDDWMRYNAWELEAGEAAGKVRRKLTSVDEIMAQIRRLRG